MYTPIKKNLALASLAGIVFCGFPLTLKAQEAPQLPSLSQPAKGETVNMSVQNGNRSQLSFGSSTSFGTSVSLNATEGISASANSQLAPAAGASLLFAIGAGDTPGTTAANIDNLRAQGTGSATIAGAPIDSQKSDFSSGKADLTGVQSSLNLTLDAARTGFTARANSVHETYGDILGQDGKQLATGSQTANASGNALVNSNTNVDINTSSFSSVFMQSF